MAVGLSISLSRLLPLFSLPLTLYICPPELYAAGHFYTGIISFLNIICGLGLRTYLHKTLGTQEETDRIPFFYSILFWWLNGMVIILSVILISIALYYYFLQLSIFSIVLITICIIFFSALYDIVCGLIPFTSYASLILSSNIIGSLLLSFFRPLFLLLNPTIYTFLFAHLISIIPAFSSACFVIYKTYNPTVKKYSRTPLPNQLGLSFIFPLCGLSISLINRLIIFWVLPSTMSIFYAISDSLFQLLFYIGQQTISFVVYPFMSFINYKKDTSHYVPICLFVSSMLGIFLAMVPFGWKIFLIALLPSIKDFIPILYLPGIDLMPYQAILCLILLASFVLFSLCNSLHQKTLWVVLAICSTVHVIISYYAAFYFGLYAILFTSILTAFLLYISMIFILISSKNLLFQSDINVLPIK